MATERQAPDAILAQTDLTGAVTAIDDDPDSPDASWLAASGNNVDTAVRVSFPTPSGTLTTGAGVQEFRAQVRKSVGSGTGTPTARIELWDNGVLVSSSSETNVTSALGQVISYTWDATGRTASTIEARVFGTKTGGSPAVRASVDVGAIEWNVTFEVSATPIAGTDAPTVSVSDSSTNAVSSARSDTASVGISDVSTNAVSSTGTEALTVGVSEASSLSAILAASDTPAITISDASSLLISEGKDGTEALSLSISDSGTVAASSDLTDAPSLSISDGGSIAATSDLSDAPTLSVSETVSVQVVISVSDSVSTSLTDATTNDLAAQVAEAVGFSMAEQITLASSSDVSDSPSLSIADASSVEEVGGITSKAGTDTLAIGITDASGIVRTFYLSVSDDPSLVITDAALMVATEANTSPIEGASSTTHIERRYSAQGIEGG